MNAIFKSLWVFSITLAASAILIESALWMPALIIKEYNFAIIFDDLEFDPEVIFTISVTLFLSPGLILSGL